MQKVPALFKLRYGKDEKSTKRVGGDVDLISNESKSQKVCHLLTEKKNYDILYTVVDYEKSEHTKTYI